LTSSFSEKLLLVLRDGRKLHGVLRSWDQFANLVLTETRERYFCTVPAAPSAAAPSLSAGTSLSTDAPPAPERKLYCDVPRGTYLVRGENVLLIGEVDLDRDDEAPEGFEEGDVEEVFRLQKEVEKERKRGDKVRGRRAGERWGGEIEGSGEVLF
jgi:U6 snRNA-associated Sm-like protein LSm1